MKIFPKKITNTWCALIGLFARAGRELYSRPQRFVFVSYVLKHSGRRYNLRPATGIFAFILASVFVFPAFVFPAFVLAQPVSRIVVEFENAPLPLFDKASFAPGETETRFIKVTNNTDEEKEVIIEVTNYSTCSIIPFTPCFAKKLSAKIYSGSDSYFEDSLSDFFGRGETSLGKISSGATKEYKMSVLFPAGEDDNDYQDAKTGSFDLLVGFKGEEGGQESGDGENGGGVTGGGGGGAAILPGLQINNEGVNNTMGNGTVSFLWDTSYASYGHIIYGLDMGTPYILDLGKSHFGYVASWPSDPSVPGHPEVYGKTQHHMMDISGLIPGATYRYRIVSHASPPTVGYEHMFTVPGGTKKADAAETQNAPEVIAQGVDEDGTIVTVTSGGAQQAVKITETSVGQNTENAKDSDVSEKDDTESRVSSNLAAVGTLGGVSIFWWLLIALIAVVGGYYILKKK